jgi:hypothetical protein
MDTFETMVLLLFAMGCAALAGVALALSFERLWRK